MSIESIVVVVALGRAKSAHSIGVGDDGAPYAEMRRHGSRLPAAIKRRIHRTGHRSHI
jgi:hypothetical protein